MPAEAQTNHPHGEFKVMSLATARSSGEVINLPDGRAGYLAGLNARAVGDAAVFQTEGVVDLTKSTSVNFLPGQEVWWDATNNVATYQLAGDFFVGTCCEEDTVAAATTTVKVDLNKRTSYLINSKTDTGVHVMTAATAISTALATRQNGGDWHMQLAATNEAQCSDWLSEKSIARTADAIAEFEINVLAAAAGATDINVGLASATSTTDADAIAESIFVHIDGASQDILLESDDGTTEVNATDTTLNWVAGTRFFVQMDMRNPADVQIYINGALALAATVFNVNVATGPFKLLFHVEKSASTDTASVKANGRVYRCLTP
jgi:predicted RecA/RadA family phage recombinase